MIMFDFPIHSSNAKVVWERRERICEPQILKPQTLKKEGGFLLETMAMVGEQVLGFGWRVWPALEACSGSSAMAAGVRRRPPVPRLVGSALACTRNDQVIVRDVNLTMHEGSAMLLTGPNASGKSSFLRLVSTLQSMAVSYALSR